MRPGPAALLITALALPLAPAPAAATDDRRSAQPTPAGTLQLLEQTRAEPDRLLARPTDGAADPEGDGYTVEEEAPLCGDAVCVHRVATSADAADAAYAQQALEVAEQVADTYAAAGYDTPLPDGGLGGDTRLDVYLADVGSRGLYGYCTTDQPGGLTVRTRWAYCVVDNDMAEFENRAPLENLRVTLAHEYFHAVQFAYDYWEDLWVMEATATWAEEQVFDDVDDNRQYLDNGQVGRPGLPLDHVGQGAQYGNWVFFQFLSEKWAATTGTMPTIVRDLWDRLREPGVSSVAGIRQVLTDRGRGFRSVYGRFAGALRHPDQQLAEGDAAAYAPATPVHARTLTRERRTTPRWSVGVDHLASQTVRIRPARSLRSHRFNLRLRLEQPGDAQPMARVLVHRRSGIVSSMEAFPRQTFPKMHIPFSNNVKYVEIVMANTDSGADDQPFVVQGRLVHG